MYLRKTRFAFFQLTSALSIATFGLASWGLSVGEDKKRLAAATLPGATLDISDALGSGGAVTAAAGVASLLCLWMNYLWWFRRHDHETMKTVRIKEGLFAFAAIFWVATLIPATIIAATRSGVVSKPGVPQSIIAPLVALSGENLAYNASTPIKSYVIVGWFAFLSTVINLILVSLAARHVLKHGPASNRNTLVGGNGNHLNTTSSSPTATMNTNAEGVHPTTGTEKFTEKVDHVEHPHGVQNV